MPSGVSRPLPALMLVMLCFSASRCASRLSGAGVKICMADSFSPSRRMHLCMGVSICPYTCAAECPAQSLSSAEAPDVSCTCRGELVALCVCWRTQSLNWLCDALRRSLDLAQP